MQPVQAAKGLRPCAAAANLSNGHPPRHVLPPVQPRPRVSSVVMKLATVIPPALGRVRCLLLDLGCIVVHDLYAIRGEGQRHRQGETLWRRRRWWRRRGRPRRATPTGSGLHGWPPGWKFSGTPLPQCPSSPRDDQRQPSVRTLDRQAGSVRPRRQASDRVEELVTAIGGEICGSGKTDTAPWRHKPGRPDANLRPVAAELHAAVLGGHARQRHLQAETVWNLSPSARKDHGPVWRAWPVRRVAA